MRSFLLILTLSLFIGSLLGVDPQLNLPDVVITGERDLKADLPIKAVDFSRFTKTDSTKAFQYLPELIKTGLRDPKISNPEQSGYINAAGGNRTWFAFDAMYHSLQKPLLIFSANGYQHHWAAFWNQTYARFQWAPDFNDFSARMEIQTMLLDTPLSDSKTEITGATLGFLQKRNPASKFFMKNSEASFSYLNAQEDAEAVTHIRDYNLSLKTFIPFCKEGMFTFRYENLNQHSQGVFGIQALQPRKFQRLGLWVGADQLHIYPSIDGLYIYPLERNLEAFLSNDPYLKNEDILLAFRSNPWQRIDGLRKNFIQEKAMINTKIGLELHSTLHFTISHQFRYRQQMPLYGNNPSKLYSRFLTNCLVQTTEFIAGYGINKFTIRNSLEYSQYKCERIDTRWLPYAGMWKESLRGSYLSSLGTTICDISYEMKRKDHLNKTLPDALLLDIKQDVQIRRNIWLNLSLNNILDRHYILYADVPYQPFNANLGGTVTF